MTSSAPCVRCPVPDVDPDPGRVDGAVGDTLGRLSCQRRGDGGTVFGVCARGPVGARLRVGDSARMILAFRFAASSRPPRQPGHAASQAKLVILRAVAGSTRCRGGGSCDCAQDDRLAI